MRNRLVVSLSVLLAYAPSSKAEAWDVSAGAGFAYGTTLNSLDKDGIGGQVYGAIGLTDTMSLSASGTFLEHCVGSGDGFRIFNVGAGITYNLDVLAIQPFAALRLGYLARFEQESRVEGVSLSISIGFDYLLSESATVGLGAEYLGLLTDFGAAPAHASFSLRFGFRLPH
jgi:hypothetical protein